MRVRTKAEDYERADRKRLARWYYKNSDYIDHVVDREHVGAVAKVAALVARRPELVPPVRGGK